MADINETTNRILKLSWTSKMKQRSYREIWRYMANYYGEELDKRAPKNEIAFTLHDYSHHCRNIYRVIEQIVKGLDMLEEETFVLAVSVLLHDISMTNMDFERQKHSEESAEFIQSDAERQRALWHNVEENLRDCIAAIVKGHSDLKVYLDGEEVIKEKTLESKDLTDEMPGAWDPQIRSRLLAGILRLADELDITRERIGNRKYIEQFDETDPEQKKSLRHWKALECFKNVEIKETYIVLEVNDRYLKENAADQEELFSIILKTKKKIEDTVKYVNEKVFDNHADCVNLRHVELKTDVKELKEIDDREKKDLGSETKQEICRREILVEDFPGEWLGREDVIDKIDKKFERNKSIFLCADAGIGKTEIAVKYSNNIKNSGGARVYFLTYTDAPESNTIWNTVAQIAKDVEQREEKLQKNEEELFNEVINELKEISLNEQIFIVVDNFDCKNIETFLNDSGYRDLIKINNLKILFTTRIDNPYEGFRNLQIRVPKFTAPQLIKLFNSIFANYGRNTKPDRQKLKGFIKASDNNTFLVVLAAKVLARSDKSVEEINTALEDIQFLYKEQATATILKDRHPETLNPKEVIRRLWNIGSLSDKEKIYMCCMGFAPVQGIYVSVLRNILEAGWEGEYNVSEINMLIDRGWIKGREKISLHPLVAELMIDTLIEHGGKFMDIPILRGLLWEMELQETRLHHIDEKRYKNYIDLCECFIRKYNQRIWVSMGEKESIRLFKQMGFLMYILARYELGEEACGHAEELTGYEAESSQEKLDILTIKARCISNSQGEEEAVEVYEEAYRSCPDIAEKNPVLYLKLIYPWGWAYMTSGKFDEAAKIYKEALEMIEKGYVKYEQGRIGEAILKDRDISPDFIFAIAQIYHGYGVYCHVTAQDDFSDAKKYYDYSISLWNQLERMKNHHYVKQVLSENAKAMVYVREGKWDKAEVEMKRTIEYCENNFKEKNKFYLLRAYENYTEYLLRKSIVDKSVKVTDKELENIQMTYNENMKIFTENHMRVRYSRVLYNWALGEIEGTDAERRLNMLRQEDPLVWFL